MSIIDTTANTQSIIPCLLSQGVDTVIRYYNFDNSSAFPEKRLELAEARSLSAKRLKLAVVFQQRQNQAADFSQLKGEAAGRRAYRYAQDSIGQPAGSAIYFSVDFDAGPNEIVNNVAPFFAGIQQAFAEESGGSPEYRVGAYGSGLVCSALAAQRLSALSWLCMSRGFRGTQEALSRGDFDIAQRGPEGTICGIAVDFNDSNPNRADFGSFSLPVEIGPAIPVTVIQRYKVMARNGLRLRQGPGTEFDIVGSLQFGQIIFVMSISDRWARVDPEGNGEFDRFASAGFLQRI